MYYYEFYITEIGLYLHGIIYMILLENFSEKNSIKFKRLNKNAKKHLVYYQYVIIIYICP